MPRRGLLEMRLRMGAAWKKKKRVRAWRGATRRGHSLMSVARQTRLDAVHRAAATRMK